MVLGVEQYSWMMWVALVPNFHSLTVLIEALAVITVLIVRMQELFATYVSYSAEISEQVSKALNNFDLYNR